MGEVKFTHHGGGSSPGGGHESKEVTIGFPYTPAGSRAIRVAERFVRRLARGAVSRAKSGPRRRQMGKRRGARTRR